MRNSAPVYSSTHGRMCPLCGYPKADCVCRARAPLPKGDGFVRIRRETKGRGGKAVAVLIGVPLREPELGALVSELKRKLSCGGSVKDGNIEIQGDHRGKLAALLRERGWKIKLAGG